MHAFAEIVTDMKCAPRQAVGASGSAGRLGDRTATLIATPAGIRIAARAGRRHWCRQRRPQAEPRCTASPRTDSEGGGERGLADARVILDERMVLGQRRDEQAPERLQTDLHCSRDVHFTGRRAIAASASYSCGATGPCSGDPFPALMSLAVARPRPAPLGRPAPCRFARLLAGRRRRRGSSPRCRPRQTRSRALRCR